MLVRRSRPERFHFSFPTVEGSVTPLVNRNLIRYVPALVTVGLLLAPLALASPSTPLASWKIRPEVKPGNVGLTYDVTAAGTSHHGVASAGTSGIHCGGYGSFGGGRAYTYECARLP